MLDVNASLPPAAVLTVGHLNDRLVIFCDRNGAGTLV